MTDPHVGAEGLDELNRTVRSAVRKEVGRRAEVRRAILTGATGYCENCGNYVRPAYVDARGCHTALVGYASVRVVCGGRVRPLEGAP